MAGSEEKFSILQHIRSDLVRANILMGKESICEKPVRLWFGVLSPRFLPILIYRISYYLYDKKIPILPKIASMTNFIVFGIEITHQCYIGTGFYLPHTQGTVIGAYCLGKNVTVFQGVTLGAKGADFVFGPEGRPQIGDNVTIGAGAKILGGITIGSQANIGANAVVLESVPDGVLAAGVPARIVKTIA